MIDVDGLVDFTRRLVRIPSVAERDGGEAAVVEAVVDLVRGWGWEPIVEEVAPGRPNCLVRLLGNRPGPTLLFEGHSDVVTAGDPEEWARDPFGGDLVDGRIHGRGSADMKGGVASMLFAARAVEVEGAFPGEIVLAVLCDEEEMMVGVHDFVARGHADSVDAAIVCEPEGGEICTTQKGSMRIRADLTGRMAHGAMPDLARNPVTAAVELLTRIRTFEAALQEEFGEHPHLGLPSLTPTHIAAGSLPQLNVIPASARFTLDIRTVPGIDHAELERTLRSVADGVGAETGVSIELTTLVDRPATETSRSEPVVEAVAAAHRHVVGREPVFGGVPGTTDGTILWRDAGIPVVVYGPGDKWIAHQADESVEVDDLVTHARVYADAARRFLTGGAVS